jgi:hypothetical protein
MAGELSVVQPAQSGGQLSVAEVKNRMASIRELMGSEMVAGVDYGTIPGTGGGKDGKGKPTLLKPGAEKLCVMFRLDVQFETTKRYDGDHLTVDTYCTVYYAPTGARLGGASAGCSTRESKYAWRLGQRTCPACGAAAIIKPRAKEGREQTWWCATFGDKGGCGLNFSLDDERVSGQQVGRIPNPDLPDSWNTVERIAEKRAMVAAVRHVTGASAIFDEMPDDPPQDGDGDRRGKPQAGNGRQQKPAAQQAKPQPAAGQQKPAANRAAVVQSALKIIAGAEDLESLMAWRKAPTLPHGFMATKDEHSQAVLDALNKRTFEMAQAAINAYCESDKIDVQTIAQLAQLKCGIADIDAVDHKGMVQLLEVVKAHCENPEPAAAPQAAEPIEG